MLLSAKRALSIGQARSAADLSDTHGLASSADFSSSHASFRGQKKYSVRGLRSFCCASTHTISCVVPLQKCDWTKTDEPMYGRKMSQPSSRARS